MKLFREKFLQIFQNKHRQGLRITVMTLAVCIVFIVTYGLILPAITLEKGDAKRMPGLELTSDSRHDEERRTSGRKTDDPKDIEAISDPDHDEDDAGRESALRNSDDKDKGAEPGGSKAGDHNGTKGSKESEKSDDPEAPKASIDRQTKHAGQNEPEYMETPLTYSMANYDIMLSFDKSAQIPAGTRFRAEPIPSYAAEYKSYHDAMTQAGKSLENTRLLRLELTKDGQEIRPKSPVDVTISWKLCPSAYPDYSVVFLTNENKITANLQIPEINEIQSELTIPSFKLNKPNAEPVIGLADEKKEDISAKDRVGDRDASSDEKGKKDQDVVKGSEESTSEKKESEAETISGGNSDDGSEAVAEDKSEVENGDGNDGIDRTAEGASDDGWEADEDKDKDDSAGDDSTGDDSTWEDGTGVDGTGDDSTGDDGTGDGSADEAKFPAVEFQARAGKVDVHVEAPEGALPDGTIMRVRQVENEDILNTITKTVEDGSAAEVKKIQAVDITFTDMEGHEIEPSMPIHVTLASSLVEKAAKKDKHKIAAVHVNDEGGGDVMPSEAKKDELSFDADRFSVYALVNYTVDFSWEVDGEVYEYSLAGGDSIAFSKLVEVLKIVDQDVNQFVEDVENIEFSAPELVWVGKIEKAMTAGEIVEKEGLEVEYSAGLTEEQIAEINAQTLEVGDWALISMKPFTSEESLTVTMENGDAFVIRVTDAAIEYSGTATVHYGYIDDSGVFQEFPSSMMPSDSITNLDTSFGWHYLIYDFYGTESNGLTYQWNYAGTYYSANGETTTPTTSGTAIQPALRYYNNKWRYFNQFSYDNSTITNNSNWKQVNSSSDIYVVYNKPAITDGGSPTLKSSAQLPDSPDILKQSVENGDGTNTLSLSITGSTAPMEVEKLADVIVILDLSSSMSKYIDSNYYTSVDYTTEASNSRYYLAKKAIQNLADTLYKRNEDADTDLYRMGLITFSNNATVRTQLTESKQTFQSALDGITEYERNGTNWEYALQLANEMSVDSGRATYIVFVTDGDPTERQTRWTLKDSQLSGNASIEDGDLFYGGMPGGTFRTPTNGAGEDKYLKFRDYFGSATFGGLWTPHFDSWDQRDQESCYDEVKSMVGHNKNFYAIGISSAVTVSTLDKLVTQAGLSSDHSTVETSADGLANAFETVLSKIDGKTGQANIKMYDGITGLTQTISKVNETEANRLIGVDGDFTYYKTSAPEEWSSWSKAQKTAYTTGMNYAGLESKPDGYDEWSEDEKAAFNKGQTVTFTEWTTREADGCAAATYNTETGAVEWNMGEKFMLEDGVTYKVSFICWPSQEAYDIIAKLNNGTIKFEDLDADLQAQFVVNDGVYTLKTNADGANAKYSTATNVNGNVSVGTEQNPLYFQHVPPMPLEKEYLNVAKTWQASKIDSQTPEAVTLQVVGDNELYKQFEITPTEKTGGSDTYNYGKSEDIYVSCGHLKVDKTTGAVVVFESGHDFTLQEVEENSRHWDLDASVCRPMKINTQRTMLVLVEDEDVPDGMTSDMNYYASGSGDDLKEYYRIDGKVYKDTYAWGDITGLNTRRSFLDLAKEVLVDDEVWAEEVDSKFTYKITITVDPTTLSWDPDIEKYVIISIRGNGYSPAAAIADETYPTTAKLPSQCGFDASNDSSYLVAETGTEFYLSIKNGWSVRFLNLPAGTAYSIEEVLADDADYEFSSARVETCKDRTSTEPDSTTSYNTKKIEGSIAETSTLYKAVYQNKAKAQKVRILKTQQDATTPLGGAKFNLYTEAAYTSDPQGTPLKTDLVSSSETDTRGQIELGSLPAGKYYLVETEAPAGYYLREDSVVITVSGTSVAYDEGTSLSRSEEGISQISELYYQLKVTNDAGVELPSTGGSGTDFICLLGIILTLLAGTGLLLKRKRWFA